MSYETLLYDVDDDGILTITLNRPEKLNAVNGVLNREIIAAFDAADADDTVRAVIMTGAGRGFCAGADLSGGADTFDYEARSDGRAKAGRGDEIDWSDPSIRDGGGLVSLRIFECLKPCIAAINGPAVGQGITMTLPMDVRIASESARFGFVFARRGIVPEACSSWFLPRLVGPSQALRWMCSGRVFDAEEARDGGLVEGVHPADELLARAREIALDMVGSSAPVSVALIRQMVWKLLGSDHPMEAHKLESRGVYALGQLDDAKEGVISFLEKRPARFKGRPSRDLPSFFPWWEEREYD